MKSKRSRLARRLRQLRVEIAESEQILESLRTAESLAGVNEKSAGGAIFQGGYSTDTGNGGNITITGGRAGTCWSIAVYPPLSSQVLVSNQFLRRLHS